MIKRLTRILATVTLGLAICAGGIWGLTWALEERIQRYEGQPLFYWLEQMNSQDAAASNHACLVLSRTVIPRLTDAMFRDTNDSRLRLLLTDQLNNLPGIHITYTIADGRRVEAVQALGEIGPHAAAATPDLIKVVQGQDAAPRAAAALALGQVQGDPTIVIPVLIKLMDDSQDGVPEAAVEGLGHFGPLSKQIVPRLTELVKVREKEMRRAAGIALKRIDPAAAEKAGLGALKVE